MWLGLSEWRKTFLVEGGSRVTLRSNEGRLRIDRGREGVVAIRAVDRGIRIALLGAWENRELQVSDAQEGADVQLQVKFPHLRWHGGFVLPLSRIELTTPAEVGLDAATGDGTVVLTELQGQFRIFSGSGSIEARVDGTLEATAANGDIRAAGRFELLNLQSRGGDIRARISAGCTMTRAWEICTTNGSIALTLPGSLAADLDADADGGRIDIETPTARHRGESFYRTRLNQGGPLLRLRCANGDIHVTTLEEHRA